jgi:hypothetical protein
MASYNDMIASCSGEKTGTTIMPTGFLNLGGDGEEY